MDHLNHHRWEDVRIFERAAQCLTLLDALANRHDRVFDDGVSSGLGGDLEAFEDRYTRRSQGRQRAAEPGDGDLANQHSEDRRPEHDRVDNSSATVGLVVGADCHVDSEHGKCDRPGVGGNRITRLHHHAGEKRKLAAKAGEELGEDRNDLPEDDPHNSDRDRDDRYRIDHGRLHLRPEFHGLFEVDRQPLEDDVQNTASLTGGDHVDEQIIEGRRLPLHRLGQGHARLDVGSHAVDDLGELLVLLLIREDLEALHERQASVEHDGELPGEDRDVLDRDPHRQVWQEGNLLALLLEIGDLNLLAAQCRSGCVAVVRDQHSALRYARSVSPFPTEARHRFSSSWPLGSRGHGWPLLPDLD